MERCANIEAKNVDTGVTRTVTTNQAGVYTINDLAPGSYTLAISAQSFGTLNQTGITVNANAVTRSDVQLKIAGVSDMPEPAPSTAIRLADSANTSDMRWLT